MDPFSVTIGIVGLVNVILKRGHDLLQLYHDYKSAEEEVAKMLLKLKVIWYKTVTQMDFLKKVWDSLDPSFQQNQQLLLAELEINLRNATQCLSTLIGDKNKVTDFSNILKKKGLVRRVRYALSVKDSLESIITEFKEWHSLFDPSWYLMARLVDDDIDRLIEISDSPPQSPIRALKALRRAIKDLEGQHQSREISSRDFLCDRTPIRYSSAGIAQFEENNNFAIVDTMVVSHMGDEKATEHKVIALSKALSRMDPSAFGLLRCCGVIKHKSNRTLGAAYDFVFEIPERLEKPIPRSLRHLLLEHQPSLNLRVNLSRHLASSVLYLHATGFVHKNIRPETILLFRQSHSDNWTLPFLVGFEQFRLIHGRTQRIGDSLPERELYRHPTRQGNEPEKKYVMQHDIYSLGVCLLEIGLWNAFYPKEAPNSRSLLSTDAELRTLMSLTDGRKRAFGIKKRLVTVAAEQLPMLTGQRFAEVVHDCLTCLDDDTASWQGSGRQSSEQIEIGVKFIENTLLRLHEIVV